MADNSCPCIDSSPIWSFYSNCIRQEEDGGGSTPGVWFQYSTHGKSVPTNNGNTTATITSDGDCYPVSFGSSECARHDMGYDRRCKGDNPHEYCFESWCYVDKEKCKMSDHSFFKSGRYDNLFYSYSTCNATADHWIDYLSTNKLEDIELNVAIPSSYFPFHYKLTTTDTGLVEKADPRGSEYYNDTVPWQGFFVNYFDDIVEMSNMGKVKYTYASKGSDVKSPSSTWTAAVHDVQAGISCLALSNFWITTERLELATFTTPLATDRLYLWIQSPAAAKTSFTEGTTSLADNVYKTLAPFDPSLWFLILGLLVFVAILSVIFATRNGELGAYYEKMRSKRWKKSSYLGRTRMFAKMSCESFLLSTTYAVTQSAGVNTQNSLAQKLVNVGFAFFILILVTAYTANLAAFLTVSLTEQTGYIKGIQDAVKRGAPVCAYAALRDELSREWPSGNFVYVDQAVHQLAAYDAGTCVGIIFTRPEYMVGATSEFCKRELVMSGPPVLEIPMGFPVCPEYAAGISHWMYKAKQKGITVFSYFETEPPPEGCYFDISDQAAAMDRDMGRLTIEDFALPLLVFACCIGLAVVSFIYHRPRFYKLRGVATTKRRTSLIPSSTIEPIEEEIEEILEEEEDGDNWQDRMEESIVELKQMMMVLSANNHPSSSSSPDNLVVHVPGAAAAAAGSNSGSTTISRRRASSAADNINASSTQQSGNASRASSSSGKRGVDNVALVHEEEQLLQGNRSQHRMSLPVYSSKDISEAAAKAAASSSRESSSGKHPRRRRHSEWQTPSINNNNNNNNSSWRTAVDPNSGDTYYYHPTTRETRWQFAPLNLETYNKI